MYININFVYFTGKIVRIANKWQKKLVIAHENVRSRTRKTKFIEGENK